MTDTVPSANDPVPGETRAVCSSCGRALSDYGDGVLRDFDQKSYCLVRRGDHVPAERESER